MLKHIRVYGYIGGESSFISYKSCGFSRGSPTKGSYGGNFLVMRLIIVVSNQNGLQLEVL